jgi:hypothetical protein
MTRRRHRLRRMLCYEDAARSLSPRRARVCLCAQEAPVGTAIPFKATQDGVHRMRNTVTGIFRP